MNDWQAGLFPQADIVGERARLTPEAPALVMVESDLGPEQRLTYAQLDERAVRMARVWTEALGLSKGDRIGILSGNRAEYVDAYFAAGKSGVVLVTLGTRLTAAELEHVVRDSSMQALIFDGAYGETVGELRRRVDLEHWLPLDGGLDQDYSGLAAGLSNEPWKNVPCHGEDVFCILYTSGTTGRPKGVMIPHRQVLWNGFNTACGWQLRADDVSPIYTPMYHAGGLMAFLVPIFVIGGTIVLHRDFDAGEVWRTIEREGCTVVLGVPTIWKMLLEAPEFESVDLTSVRWLISGGAPLPEYLIEAYQEKGVVFMQGFGMTEVGVNCFAMTVEDSLSKRGSIGKPMMFTEAKLIDEEGAVVGPNEVGELCFRGPHVCLGYWNHPDGTAKSLDDDGWFHSGDLAKKDEDGYFYVAGREKDMIISGGVNIYPAEIEAVLLQHPGVEDAAVVAVPHDRWGEVGVAFVVLRADGKARDETLIAFLGEQLARYKIPKTYRFVDALPRTAYGKVVKGELRDAYLAETSAGTSAGSTGDTAA